VGLSAVAEDRADAALRALAEPRRRAILRLVSDQERSAGEIAAEFDVSRPAISQHLAVLKEAELVTERRDGTRRLYRARQEGLLALRALLTDLWGSGLARAAALAEAEDAPEEAR
jgi:DNA-binding transcriptional ArsR family regulator